VTCPNFVYPRETIFGAKIAADHLHHPIVRGLPGAFRMPRGKYMCDEKEWRRCVAVDPPPSSPPPPSPPTACGSPVVFRKTGSEQRNSQASK
jgi:hypothetical protein